MLRRLVARSTRSASAARLLFGGRFPALGPGEHYFDVTTVALRRRLAQRVAPGSRVLDVGTGSAAVLGLWMWRRLGCEVTCAETDPELAARAREAIRANGAPLAVVEEPWLAGAPVGFDFVVCNPPYVPTEAGRARGLPERWRAQWDGGPDGAEPLRALLADFAARGGRATAIVGVNRRHVPRERVLGALAARSELLVEEPWAHPLLPVDVYAFRNR